MGRGARHAGQEIVDWREGPVETVRAHRAW